MMNTKAKYVGVEERITYSDVLYYDCKAEPNQLQK